MDKYLRLGSNIVRVLRASKSQEFVNRKLGFKSNQVNRWESGKSKIRWSHFLDLSKICNVPIAKLLQDELGYREDARDSLVFFKHLIVNVPLKEISKKTGLSRFQIGNILKGKTDLTLDVVLNLLDNLHEILWDFVSKLPNTDFLDPFTKNQMDKSNHQRKLQTSYPWIIAVFGCFNLPDYKKLSKHETGWIAKKIGISLAQELETIEHLEKSKAIALKNFKYHCQSQLMIMTRGDFNNVRVERIYWLQRSLEALKTLKTNPINSRFMNSTFAVSAKERKKITAAYENFILELKKAIDPHDTETESLITVAVQLLDLEEISKQSQDS